MHGRHAKQRQSVFSDRAEAGQELARELLALPWTAPVVLALPRGGVPVAAAVARALNAPLDLLLVRKIGAPSNPELAVAAVAERWPPHAGTCLACDDRTMAMSAATRGYIDEQRVLEEREIGRRRALYLGSSPRVGIRGAEVVLVDDGVATGTTVRAALMSLRDAGVGRVVLAVPVAAAPAARELSPLVDRMVCLWQPQSFSAVGLHYRDFRQVKDEEVVRLLAQVRGPARPDRSPGAAAVPGPEPRPPPAEPAAAAPPPRKQPAPLA